MPFSRRKFMHTAVAASLGASAFGASAESQTPAAAKAPARPKSTPLVAVADYEHAAVKRLPHAAREYITGGAADELTLRWNREAYDRIKLKPRILADLKQLDTRVELLGSELPFPIFLCPAASHQLCHPEGERATARGATAAHSLMILSSFTNTAVEEVAKAARTPLWFQLYAQPDRGFTRAQVQRAEAAGCRALVVTVDTPVAGARNREQRAGFQFEGLPLPHLPKTESRLSTEREVLAKVLDFNLNWNDIEWLRAQTKMRVLIKGVLDPDDARIAVREKLDGLVVSNHGARNLDTVPATIEALPRICDVVGGAMPVLVDGGVRRGTDVLKALACGATAVGIGRAYLYGLTVGGAKGVEDVVNILRTEFEMAMALSGRDSIKQLDRSVLWDECRS